MTYKYNTEILQEEILKSMDNLLDHYVWQTLKTFQAVY